MPDIKSMTMKLNGGQPPVKTPDAPAARSSSGQATPELRDGATPVPRADPLKSAQQQLMQLRLSNNETALARVAGIIQQKGGGHELLLELRGRALAVSTGPDSAGLSAGDLIKVMRAGNELRLLGKLAPGPDASIARALAQRLPWQQNLQAGLGQLLQSLTSGLKPALQPGQPPAGNATQPLPALAQQQLQNLLASLPRSDALAPGVGKTDGIAQQVRQWLTESGVFAESRLLHSSQAQGSPTDLKLALARVAGALLAAQGQRPEHFNRLTPLASHDLVQSPLQFPNTTGSSSTSTAEPLSVAQTLRLLAGMLNRITVNQLHSQVLTARAGAEPGTPTNTLLIELPWLTPHQEPRMAQLRLEQYERDEESAKATGHATVSEWRLALSMDLDEAGPLHFDVSFRYPSVSAQVWAEKQSTLRQVHEELPLLRQSLTDLGLEVKDLDCRRGSPQRTQTRLEHRLVDTKA
ncbi:flagellar hook-length control protein FliK [Marinobacter alkaliphilus]|uniref:Flagellar hook-length control protein FliK n=1 Tax=Marinobacter alkaliphilus TaxID=254719 RepID=A0ABZ3E6J3_9GAMM